MQDFSQLLQQAKNINKVNINFKKMLPDNIKNIDLVKIENQTASIIIPNNSMLNLVKSLDLLPYFDKLNLNITSIKLAIKN